MLLIAAALMPYFKSLSAETYRSAFQAIGPFLGNLMIPLLLSSIVLSALAVFVERESRLRHMIAFCLVIAIVPLYVFVHAPVNGELLGVAPLSDFVVIQLRDKWFFLHWTRTILGVSAFGLSIF
jgi:hypothetical protein